MTEKRIENRLLTNHISKITILGAGVSGITTGIVLQLLGYQTGIIAKDRADNPRKPDDPAFASLYPSASIIPHSVFGDKILSYIRDSQRLFHLLHHRRVDGLTINRHYEVFEYEQNDPAYASCVDHFHRIPDHWRSVPLIPHHSSTDQLYGWSFNCLFADWPIYLPRLFHWYKQLGGSITIRRLHREELDKIRSPLINCTGLAGQQSLFGDPDRKSSRIMKGHLIKIMGTPDLQNRQGQTISYNYNPRADLYSDEKGNSQDLYCYPRSDGWILGGSRLKGTIDKMGNWQGNTTEADTTNINGIPVPTPILEMNRDILATTFGVSLANYADRTAYVGYRFICKRQGGLRLEKGTETDGMLIHNYGHGGAGVTLSWGCAIEVARLLQTEGISNNQPGFSHPLFDDLQKSLLTLIEKRS